MDFLKSLMLYLSLTLAGGMQAAPLPEETPVPTAPPAVVETIAPVQDAQSSEAAITPQPPQQAQSATVVPAPTITPNAGYRNVKQGQRGENVQRLQQRLIELGYLEEGSADGVFGGQTRKAVMAFQEANGLTADGVAGDATQTHLYENPNVKPNPNRATPTPEVTPTLAPTATPEITPEPQSTIAPPQQPVEEPQPAQQGQWLEAAIIVYNDEGAPLTCLRLEDGVTVSSKPRLYRMADGAIYLALADLAAAIEGWDLAIEGTAATLTAEGYVIVLDGGSCTVDSASIPYADGDAAMIDDVMCISTSLLEKALDAQAIWDEEEATLMLRILSKELAQATD